MPLSCTALRLLIASPGDVSHERLIARQVVEGWNTRNGAHLSVVFLPIMWELHSVPEQGDRPQAIINKQIVGDADALLAVFWTRLGTPTGVAESGTAEEIRELKAAGKHVAIYFSKRHVDPYQYSASEFARLQDFRNWCKGEGLIAEFCDDEDFKGQLERLLDLLANRHRTSQPTKNNMGHAAKEELTSYLAHAAATWKVEKDSGPVRIDDGKRILRGIGDTLLRIATSDREHSVDIEAARKLATETRTAQQFQVYLDGGDSYRRFWELGDDIVKRAEELAK